MFSSTMLTITLGLLIVALSLFYYFCIKPMRYWKEKGVIQTKPLWIFGDMFKPSAGRITFVDWLVRLYHTFPDSRYFGFYQYSLPTLVIRDPDLIKQITVKDFDHFVDHRTFITEKADPLWANNLVALKGQRWRDMRPVLSPFFTSSKMKQMFLLMSDSAKRFADYFLEKNEDIVEIELKDVFTRYCNDVIATTAFGVEVDSLRVQDNEFYMMGKEATTFTGFWKGMKLLLIFTAPKLCEILKVQFLSTRVKKFFYNLVDETVKVREENNIIRPDMMHLLMQVRKGNVEQENEISEVETGFSTAKEALKGKASRMQISNQQMASQAMIFFFGGFDSVSTLMCYMSYELAINPDIQKKLRDEVEETFVICGGNLTYDALSKMKYMDMVVSETLRKWPNAVVLDRECTKPYSIEPARSDEKPVNLVRGDLVWIPVYAIHRDEQYYPDPEKFDPERFSDENRGNINPLTYIPFGSGPRNCIGSRFALLESKAVIFHILHSFEIVPTSKSQIPVVIGKNFFLLLPDNGFWFGLKRIQL